MAFTLTPFRGTDEEIEQIAGKVRDLFRDRSQSTSPSDWLRHGVRLLGGKVEIEREPAPYEASGGSLTIINKNEFLIRLSIYTSPLRDNFTLAHELGHYFLHYPHDDPPSGPVVFTRYGSDPVEWQANRFAAALLMPKAEFKRVWKRSGEDVYRVAGHFQVSPPAVEVRAKYLCP